MKNSNKPTYEQIGNSCPEVNQALIKEHLSRLGKLYFQRFNVNEICEHLNALSQLSSEIPVTTILNIQSSGIMECTILAFDYPSEFSLITGLLSSLGYRIISGDIFTYKKPVKYSTANRYKRGSLYLKQAKDSLRRKRIIDHFSGYIETNLPLDKWIQRLKKKLNHIFHILENNKAPALEQAKRQVNEMVAASLAELQVNTAEMLFPIYIETDTYSTPYTKIHIKSEDTPFFLYTLSSALSLHNVSIEQVRIHTINKKIEDDFYVTDLQGKKIDNPVLLDKIKLSILLTKQFTYFLGNAPDPYAALCRFESIVTDLLKMPEKGRWFDLLSNPKIMQELARLLGASDFLWEDFIRSQYETLLPMLLPTIKGKQFSKPVETIAQRLNQVLQRVTEKQEKIKRLNQFKDLEIYLIDLDHILTPHIEFQEMSRRLTILAEAIINKALDIEYQELKSKYGTPMTIGGLEANYAIFGLGKLGGAALGYASDIELLFIYSDNGSTNGSPCITNAEFFEKLIKQAVLLIQAKREGIFQVDMRLRPHGTAGPYACSLENFCRYYGKGGQAYSFERLALVRLRKIGGDPKLGAQVERIRDEIVYESKSINPQEILKLREKQYKEKKKHNRFNAKFSPGGLVDLEYSVQILQIIHGINNMALRTPILHEALKALAEAHVLTAQEAERLIGAYSFFRKLINGLRMLRGSAQDLFLPPIQSDETAHLARRIGYEYTKDLSPEKQLFYDLQSWAAQVRIFVEHYFGRESLPGPEVVNAADLILSDEIDFKLIIKVLKKMGFKQGQRAYKNLRSLAGDGVQREHFSRLALLACDILSHQPDPDMALNNWERFAKAIGNTQDYFPLLLSQPRRLEILLSIFAGSHFLTNTLVRNPEFLEWVTQPQNLHKIRELPAIKQELSRTAMEMSTPREWLNFIRKLRRREILRIGTRDMCLQKSISEITLELSIIAEGIIDVVLENIWQHNFTQEKSLYSHFCIMAFGKLGGRELNYSSDIDLLGIYDENKLKNKNAPKIFKQVMEKLTYQISAHTEEGYAYRVDLRLRPYGQAGLLVQPISSLLHYYQNAAALWEIQALLKMRPVAGNLELGYKFQKQLKPLLQRPVQKSAIVSSINTLRDKAIKNHSRSILSGLDVKVGMGGLRDIEFLVQGLQRIHIPTCPDLLNGNTLASLDLLAQTQILSKNKVTQIKNDYTFLRRIEHYLQILEDRQTYKLPQKPEELKALAKRVLGAQATVEYFNSQLQACLKRVRAAYCWFLEEYNRM